MADTVPDQSTTELVRSGSGAADIVQSALLEAARIRLEALQAGERIYEDLLAAARARCEQIVAAARQEAQQIITDAEQEALHIRRGIAREDSQPEAALEQLRFEMAEMVRTLRQGLGEMSPPPAGYSQPALSNWTDKKAVLEVESDGLTSRPERTTALLSSEALTPREARPGETRTRYPLDNGATHWVAPDWMRDEP